MFGNFPVKLVYIKNGTLLHVTFLLTVVILNLHKSLF